MSKLEELLQEVNVEWKILSEISNIGTGNSNRQDEDEKGIYPFYVRSKKILKSNTYQFDEISIIIPGEGGIGDIFHYVEGKYALHQRAYRINIISNYIVTKYVYYIMLNSFKHYISGKSIGTTATSIRKPMLEKFKIPIPCPDNPEKSLEIQQEIVRVLDELTSLTNQLTTELETERQNRKKQFEFFREQLFAFEEGEIQIKPLIEIAEIGTGSRNTNEAVIDGQYPFFVRSQIPRAINEFEFDETAIITAGDGVGVGKVFHYISGKYALHQRAYRIVLKSNILSSKYLFYYIKNNFSKYIEKISVHASVTSLRKPMFEKYPIPIPSLAEQERIVKLLDQYDATHTAIEEEITKEIKLRTQQYEYYREKLLSFPSLRTT